MKLVRCEKVKGHFYDADKYDGCPYCGEPVIKPQKIIAAAEAAAPASAPRSFDETVMLTDDLGSSSNKLYSEIEETADFSDDYSTEELIVEEVFAEPASASRGMSGCALCYTRGGFPVSCELPIGESRIGTGNCGCDVRLDSDDAAGIGEQAVIRYKSAELWEISPINGGSVYINGYYLMTAVDIGLQDKLTVGGVNCMLLRTDRG